MMSRVFPHHPSPILTGIKFLLFLIIGLVAFTPVNQTLSSQVYANANNDIPIKTESLFTQEIITDVTTLPFKTRLEYDDTKDKCDDEQIVQPGVKGSRTKSIQITYYQGEEYERHTFDTVVINPVEEVRVKGTKKIYKTMETDSGTINYWCELGVFRATAYDPTCPGCSNTTAIGLKAGFGVVAVDPKIIPLRSQLYITGYGKAIAGDTGGAIKGRRVDLGFDSIGAWWGVRDAHVYLL